MGCSKRDGGLPLKKLLALGSFVFLGCVVISATASARPARPAASSPSVRPVIVRLGTHRFGHTRIPDAVVARAGPKDVYFPAESCCGPTSFEVGLDRSVWLLDGGNQRLLVWRAGHPDVVARSMKLPHFCCEDFALGPAGTLYVTQAGTADHPLNFLYQLKATGEVLWQSTLAAEGFPTMLRAGPSGILYSVSPRRWVPAVTPGGRPLSVSEQRRRTVSGYQPLPGGRRLLSVRQSPHEWRFSLIDRGGRVTRAWQVVSRTRIGPILAATPDLVGGDPVVFMDVSARIGGDFKWEYLALRLGPHGTRARLSLPAPAAWGDVITDLRVGPDGKLYQLGSSPTTGVAISRYSLGPVRLR
jgi:hypothetical protein